MLFSKRNERVSKRTQTDLDTIKSHDFSSLMGQVRRSRHLKDVQQAFAPLKKQYHHSKDKNKHK